MSKAKTDMPSSETSFDYFLNVQKKKAEKICYCHNCYYAQLSTSKKVKQKILLTNLLSSLKHIVKRLKFSQYQNNLNDNQKIFYLIFKVK